MSTRTVSNSSSDNTNITRKGKSNASRYSPTLKDVEDESDTPKNLSPKSPNSVLELESDEDDKDKDCYAKSDSTKINDDKNIPELSSTTLQAELGEFITVGEEHN